MAPLSTVSDVVKLTKEVKTPKARDMAKQIAYDPMLNDGIMAMMERQAEMRSPLTALLAGIAANPIARRMWEDSLDEEWSLTRAPTTLSRYRGTRIIPEVLIGAGMTAAIYCAERAKMGRPLPIILDESPRAGGAFASSKTATFYLNSRNRPGGLSIPRREGALNFLPGSVVQPSDLSGEEYQVNSDLAFAIRSVFALLGVKVITNVKVQAIQDGDVLKDGRRVKHKILELRPFAFLRADRVIVASGIGEPRRYWSPSQRAATPGLFLFREFLAHLDKPFPFRGMRRVAVIGSGDSGKCAVEALTGQGPSRHMSVASLDWPAEVVWYGQPNGNRADFEACNRPRYKRIGTLLDQSVAGRRRRVSSNSSRVDYVDPGYDCVLVNGEPFDAVVDCTGYYPNVGVAGINSTEFDVYQDAGRVMPTGNGDYTRRVFFVGPAAQLPRTPQERMAVPDAPDVRAQNEANVAAYRYAGRTAMLAQLMG